MATRTLSGAITFGMVTIPIRTYGSVKENHIGFNQLHGVCNARIRQDKVCTACEETVSGDEIAKGYEIAKGVYVQVTDAELETLPLRTTKAVEVLAFVPPEDLDAVMYERFDWVGPDEKQKVGQKAFVLFQQALTRSGLVAIAKTSKAGKEQLCVIFPKGKTLQMARLYWTTEVLANEFDAAVDEIEISKAEADMADKLVKSMKGTAAKVFASQTDGYHEALTALLDAKAAGTELPAAAAAPKAMDTDNLLAALSASLESVA